MAEEVFLKHLRSIYARDTGVAVTIKKGKGGTAVGIVQSAVNYTGAFDRKAVIIDNDKPKKEMMQARSLAKTHGIGILENTPCLEKLFLEILEPKSDFKNKNSTWCKNEFQKKYIEKKKRAEMSEYQKIFTKKVLDKAKGRIEILQCIISLMDGKLK